MERKYLILLAASLTTFLLLRLAIALYVKAKARKVLYAASQFLVHSLYFHLYLYPVVPKVKYSSYKLAKEEEFYNFYPSFFKRFLKINSWTFNSFYPDLELNFFKYLELESNKSLMELLELARPFNEQVITWYKQKTLPLNVWLNIPDLIVYRGAFDPDFWEE